MPPYIDVSKDPDPSPSFNGFAQSRSSLPPLFERGLPKLLESLPEQLFSGDVMAVQASMVQRDRSLLTIMLETSNGFSQQLMPFSSSWTTFVLDAPQDST
jgi:hypothetical protein